MVVIGPGSVPDLGARTGLLWLECLGRVVGSSGLSVATLAASDASRIEPWAMEGMEKDWGHGLAS